MKIVVVGGVGVWSVTEMYGRALMRLGHNVQYFSDSASYNKFGRFQNPITNKFFWRQFARHVQSELISFVEGIEPDLVLILKGLYIRPDTLDIMKRKCEKTKVVCWQVENPFSNRKSLSNQWVRDSIKKYDAYLTWGKFLIPKLKQMGASNVILHPFAHDPELHYPTEPTRLERQIYGSDIAIIGSWYKNREKVINQLSDFDVKIWGNSWHRARDEIQECWSGRLAHMEEFSKVCNSSKIILDILKPAMVQSHSLKSFEIPACKGFLVCNSGKELSEYYNNGEDIVWFDKKKDLVENLNYLIRSDGVRSRIADSGYQSVQKHTFDARAKGLLDLYETL